MKYFFAYGSLMCEDIMQEVSGCCLSKMPGILRGYSRRPIKDELYPAIIPDNDGLVDGIIYRDVPGLAWGRLDRFEGEMYSRQSVLIELMDGSTLDTATYVLKPEFMNQLEPYEWDFTDFLCNHKEDFVNCYKGYFAL